jgi:hypothetical protein
MFKPHHLCATLALIALAGCSSTPPAASDTEPRTISGQRLSSQFQREGIKVEFECRSRTGIIDRTCVSGDITAIEVTGYANSFGNSEANRENAFAAAQDEALSKLSRFIQQDINTSRVNDTFAKNIEKANDVLSNKGPSAEPIQMNDIEAQTSSYSGNRQNTNETVRTIKTSITTQSQAIVRGARVLSEKIVDKQTVAVTLRWERLHSKAVTDIQKMFR